MRGAAARAVCTPASGPILVRRLKAGRGGVDSLRMVGQVPLVMFIVLLMQLVAALAWLLGHWALALPRGPALHWLMAALLGAGATGSMLLRGSVPLALAMPLGNLLSVAAALAMTRGMRLFLDLPTRDREAGAMLAAMTVTGLVAGLEVDSLGVPVLAFVTSLCVFIVFAQAAWQGAQALRREFDRRVAVALALPMVLMCAMVLLRLAGAASGGAQALHVESRLNVAVAVVYLLVVALLHLSMAAMVVLRLVASLRQLSTRDALTGLLNRREWVVQMQAQHRWLGRFGEPYAVLMIDIDHFKRVNDTWGHPAGDAVLVHTAQVLLGSVRAMDVVGRLGGEEFAVLMPRTGAEAAVQVAERLRQSLADSAMGWKHASIEVTVSIGVAGVEDADEAPERVIERADALLYAAKHGGRNRVAAQAAAAERDAA